MLELTASAPSGSAVQADEASLSADEGSGGGGGEGEGDKAGPDLDVLARKVYKVLRRRLAAERRRGLWS